MTESLYLTDSYLREWDAAVLDVIDGKHIILDKTAFYPQSGGQPSDFGSIFRGEEEYKMVSARKQGESISHEVDKQGLQPGDAVHCSLDWERRYKLMRCHTAAHIISQAIHKDTGALITGNQLDVEQCRIDFSLDDYDPEQVKQFIDEANGVVQQDLRISYEFKSREEAMQMPGISKLAKGLPESIQILRILAIGTFDIQADGGTHVHSTKEVGIIKFIKTENKGKNNRRLYFSIA